MLAAIGSGVFFFCSFAHAISILVQGWARTDLRRWIDLISYGDIESLVMFSPVISQKSGLIYQFNVHEIYQLEKGLSL